MSETYAGEERRSVGRDGTNFTEEQVENAGKRVLMEKKTIDESEFTEGDLMRTAIKKKLGVVSATSAAEGQRFEPAAAVPGIPESQEVPEFSLEKFAEANYDKAINALTDGEKVLYNPETAAIKAPSKEDVLARLSRLTPDQLEVARKFKRPVLVIEPEGLSYGKFVDNLNRGTRTRNDVIVTDSRKEQFALQDKALGIKGDGAVTGWIVGIAEGADELDGKSGVLENLISNWEHGEQAKKGAVLVDHTKFALMEKQAIIEGRRLDRVNWSVFSRRDNNNETVCEDGLVSDGRCSERDDHVGFSESYPSDRYSACFRAIVIAPKS